jgi:hypothetical protein
MGNYADAEPLYKESVSIRKKVLGEEHPLFASSLNILGSLYQDMSNYTDAEVLYGRSIAITKKVFGRRPPRLCTQPCQPGLSLSGYGKLCCSRTIV